MTTWGHGASVSKMDDLGFFAAKDGWRVLIQDTEALTDLMQERYPELPYFILGHSMGSLISRLYLTEYGEKLRGAISLRHGWSQPDGENGMRLSDSVAHAKGMTYRSAFPVPACVQELQPAD